MTDFATLLEGYRRFRQVGWSRQRARWSELAEKQDPGTMVIACSDSRVDPSAVFDTAPGEIFVVRNIANLVPPFETGGGRHGVSAAIEFAVNNLKVREIVVLGHGQCGGVAAALAQTFAGAAPGEGGFIGHWVDLLDDARTRVLAAHDGEDQTAVVRAMEQEAVKVSLANLRTFPFVAAAEADGRLRLQGAYFAIRDGVLALLDEESGSFSPA